jgi:hypothetical protein
VIEQYKQEKNYWDDSYVAYLIREECVKHWHWLLNTQIPQTLDDHTTASQRYWVIRSRRYFDRYEKGRIYFPCIDCGKTIFSDLTSKAKRRIYGLAFEKEINYKVQYDDLEETRCCKCQNKYNAIHQEEILKLKTREYIRRSGISESKYQHQLAEKLKKNGWVVYLEKKTPNGRIDILAEKSGNKIIIETKLSSGLCNMQRAIGQLLLYRHCIPEAKLYIATPEKPSEEILGVLNSVGIEYYEASKGET